MYKQCVLFLLVSWVVSASSISAGRWSKRQADISDLQVTSPPDVSSPPNASSPPSVESQESTAVQSDQESQPIVEVKNQWAEVLNATSWRLNEAFENYDRAKATWSKERALFAEDIKFFKLAFDTYYFLYTQRDKELEKKQQQLHVADTS